MVQSMGPELGSLPLLPCLDTSCCFCVCINTYACKFLICTYIEGINRFQGGLTINPSQHKNKPLEPLFLKDASTAQAPERANSAGIRAKVARRSRKRQASNGAHDDAKEHCPFELFLLGPNHIDPL